MISVMLPDGSAKQLSDGASAADLAKSISDGLARVAVAAKVNDAVVDLQRPLPDG
ncbi:MAG: TGS domain-containing protein, partial [Planctomycetes bacterium]|nr:TGS domain-containing protein [Planctomycetota bacterium]